MAVIKAEGRREFFNTYMRFWAISEGFTDREVMVAAEFLYYLDRYKHTPLKKEVEDVDDDGNLVVIVQDMTLREQLMDKRTLRMITTQLDMSFSVFRKYVKGLVEKGFFSKGEIASKFIPSDNYVGTFKVQLK